MVQGRRRRTPARTCCAARGGPAGASRGGNDGIGPSDRPVGAPSGPRRTCIGCRTTTWASELVRVVATPGGGLVERPTSAGRGAWLCHGSVSCVDAAARRRAFDRALRIAITTEAVASLRDGMARREPLAGRGRM
ncbi:MAG: YlxR family protein [Acidimicrobiales bacterium]